MAPQDNIFKEVEKFDDRLPHFPDGRIDYSTSDTAPVVVVFVEHEGKYLFLKRSDEVRTYKGKWDTVAGYIDEVRPVREKVLEELREEVGITEDMIEKMTFGEPLEFDDKEIGILWMVQPVRVELRSLPEIKLDREHTEYRWVTPTEFNQFDAVPDLERNFSVIKDL